MVCFSILGLARLVGLLLAITWSVDSQTPIILTEQEKPLIVNRHNENRATVEAGNMKLLVWDKTLAARAEAYATQCSADFSPTADRVGVAGFDYVGQNIAWGSVDILPSVAAIVDKWWSERADYVYGVYPDTCLSGTTCGHFTQMAWANTCSVGCGASLCDQITDGGEVTSGYIFVCEYGAGGNRIGETPWIQGENCEACAGTCVDGLCDPVTCPDDGSVTKPPDNKTIPEECYNAHALCPYWASIGECYSNAYYMMHYCPGSCNGCPRVGLRPEPPCQDYDEWPGECAAWADAGVCDSSPFYTAWKCRLSCGYCHPSVGPVNGGYPSPIVDPGTYGNGGGGMNSGYGTHGGGGYGLRPIPVIPNTNYGSKPHIDSGYGPGPQIQNGVPDGSPSATPHQPGTGQLPPNPVPGKYGPPPVHYPVQPEIQPPIPGGYGSHPVVPDTNYGSKPHINSGYGPGPQIQHGGDDSPSATPQHPGTGQLPPNPVPGGYGHHPVPVPGPSAYGHVSPEKSYQQKPSQGGYRTRT